MAEDQTPNPQNHQQQQEKEEEKEEEEEGESSSQSHPSKVARLSSDPGAVTMAVASPLGLGLGLGLGGGDETLTKAATGFTFMQRQEYHHQDLIFKHMMAGVPVPIHLILPIWKSVAASYGPHHYPSFVGLGNLCYDFRNSMEPEPGRCRRTDGKKWRCSRDVVPEQKYCERHMHRGRNRSRKPVEGAGTTAATRTDPSNTALDNDGLTNSNSDNNNNISNNSTSSSININSSSNDVSMARVGSSLISVLSSNTCKTVAS